MSLRVEGIWKTYGAREVLRGVDLEVAPGEIYGLLGPNGSGKSTALQVVAGLLTANRGQVLAGGRRVSGGVRARLGFVPQEPALYPLLSCVETLRFFGRVYGVPRGDLRSRVEAATRSTGLNAYRTTRAQALSGGWRQRLSLASALVHDPDFLVLDEPTTGLDVQVRLEVWDLLDSLAKGGTSVLFASHNLEEAESHCHRVGILDGRRIAAEGSPGELRRLIPATAVAEIGVDDASALLARSRERGWDARRRGGQWLLLLRSQTTIPDLAQEFTGLPLRSLSLRPVNLEDVFLEVTSDSEPRTEAEVAVSA
ncbi:ATP-binding cassette domain-containing protein [Gemmatimonadota bacterium]